MEMAVCLTPGFRRRVVKLETFPKRKARSLPPTTSTEPSGSNVAVCQYRGTPELLVPTVSLISGWYSSELPACCAEGLPYEVHAAQIARGLSVASPASVSLAPANPPVAGRAPPPPKKTPGTESPPFRAKDELKIKETQFPPRLGRF